MSTDAVMHRLVEVRSNVEEWRKRTITRLKTTGGLIRSNPHIIIVPIVVCGLMLGLGLWGLMEGSKAYAETSKQRARLHLDSALVSLQLSVQAAITPGVQLADWVVNTRNFSAVQQQWADRVPRWWSRAPQDSLALAMAPAGVITRVFPSNPVNRMLLGQDVMRIDTWRMLTLEQMANRTDLAVAGPVEVEGIFSMAFQLMIDLPVTSSNETWGIPFNPYKCPIGYCYRPENRTKWWGMAILVMNASGLLSPTDGPLARVYQAGYQLQIWRPPYIPTMEPPRVFVGTGEPKPQPDDAVSSTVDVGQKTWEVFVWLDTWQPNWTSPLAAVVVVGALLISALLFGILLSWAEHRVLLCSVLPKAAIKRMRAEMDWTTPQDEMQSHLKVLELETPAQQMLSIIKAVHEGLQPEVTQLVAVQAALTCSQDVYRPGKQDLQTRIKDSVYIDREVRDALVQQLVGRNEGHICSSGDLECDIQIDEEELTEDESEPESQQSGSDAGDEIGTVQDGEPEPTKAAVRELSVDHKASRRGSVTDRYKPGSLEQVLVVSKDSLGRLEPRLSMKEDSVSGSQSFSRPDFSMSPQLFKNLITLTSSDANAADLIPASNMHVRGRTRRNLLPKESESLKAELKLLLPEKPIYSQLEATLPTVNRWDFDPYAFEEVSNGRPLSVLAFYLMSTSGCNTFARINQTKLARFLRRVEEGYPDNPYHCRRHAAYVLQTLHMILHQGGLAPGYVDQLAVLACYISAIVHDFEHKGCTNDFLINTHDDLAVRYNDKSPMENHHLAATFHLLKQPECNFLTNLSKMNWIKLRKLVIEMVLATDMKQHFAILTQFSTLHVAQHRGNSFDGRASNGNSARSSPQENTPVAISDSDKLLSMQMALKCADLGHLAAPLPIHLRWVAALETEFFMQGNEEKARGMPLSPLCDRTKEGVTKSQVAFFDFVVMPLYTHFTEHFQRSKPLLRAVMSNYQHWQAAGKASNP